MYVLQLQDGVIINTKAIQTARIPRIRFGQFIQYVCKCPAGNRASRLYKPTSNIGPYITQFTSFTGVGQHDYIRIPAPVTLSGGREITRVPKLTPFVITLSAKQSVSHKSGHSRGAHGTCTPEPTHNARKKPMSAEPPNNSKQRVGQTLSLPTRN